MKPSYIKLSKITRFAILASMMFLITTTQVKAQSVDLQAVSIDPSPATIAVGQTGQIIVQMRNNTGTIPIGQATATITLSSVYLDVEPIIPIGFTDNCNQWSYLGNVPGAGTHNLFFQNNAGAIPTGGGSCFFQFNVRGKTGTPSPSAITLASSLSAIATVNDVNGTNQDASTLISVTGIPDLTTSQFFTTTQVASGGTIDEVVAIRNVGASATSAPSEFSVTTYLPVTGLTVSSNPAPSVTIGFTTYPLDNANWTFNSGAGTFTSNAGVFIPAGGIRYLGVRIVRGTGASVGANGTVNQTVTITNGTGGGETPTNNNTINNTLLKN